jgi:protoheme IX farnesyltransferase
MATGKPLMKTAPDMTHFDPPALEGTLETAIEPSLALPAHHSVGVSAAEERPSRLVDYYELTKPRMNFLIVVTTMVGYYMASGPSPDPWHWLGMLHVLLGTALTASAAGVFNQYIEREYDALMPRTRNRPLPAGRLTRGEARAFGFLLGVGGVGYLARCVNLLTAGLGAFTLLSYVFIYTPVKRRSTLNTIIGAVPGALPPVMGWTAYHNTLSREALVLFAILFVWQIPHFLAIAILYCKDYKAGGFKMLPVVDPGLYATSRQIIVYSLALIPVTLVPVIVGMAGTVYLLAATALGIGFLGFGLHCARTKSRADARKLFFASIIYLPLLFAFMMINRL